ncbi:MAG TPA: DUF4919 domain-containing protein [Candidatus Edwardsbacteria bacterium]|nr:DUF4919 domain-containing protein [Candidatus Edwardsbacteria bacterium]
MPITKRMMICGAALLALAGGLRAQKYSQIDFDSVQQRICDARSRYYYPPLLKHYLADDVSLRVDDYVHLYYGYVFHDQYRPVDPVRLHQEQELQAQFKAGKYKRAAALARRLLRQDPLNTDYLYWTGRCAEQRRDSALALRCRARWRNLVEAIRASGDGRSRATAFVVIRVPDEYQLLQALRLEYTAHLLHEDRLRQLYYDLFTLKPNRLGLDTLYFNTNWSYQFLAETIDTFSEHHK